MARFNRKWIHNLVVDPRLPDSAKLTLLAAIVNCESEHELKITYNRLAQLRGVDAGHISMDLIAANDQGWILAKPGSARLVGTISEPQTIPPRPKRKVTIVKPAYDELNVRDWGAKHFVEYFVALFEETGKPMALPISMLSRRLMKDGVDQLRTFDRSKVHPKIRYRSYLEWAIKHHAWRGDKLLRDKGLMQQFVAATATETTERPRTVQDQLDEE